MSAEKDTIYIDVDDEITNVIDKVVNSDHKVVAVVLPKRAAVMQSIINMKLLKRSAEKAKKSLVLITSEAGLLPLAGTVGIHVAKNLQSKPAIPDGVEDSDIPQTVVDEAGDEPEDDEPELDNKRSVGELSGQPASKLPVADEAIEIDNEPEKTPLATNSPSPKKAKNPKDKKLKVPNFDRFRKWLFLGGAGLIVLVLLGYMALFAWPKATITLQTDTSTVNATYNFTVSTTNKDFDEAKQLVPGQLATTSKNNSQSGTASGQQNNGNRASGNVTISNCTNSPVTIAAGTGVSAAGKTYITQQSLSLDSGNFTFGGTCKTSGSHVDTTPVIAQSPGASYNVSAQDYSVAGYSSSSCSSGVCADGTAMAGGTDNIQTVVTQSDIDGTKAKIASVNSQDVQNQLSGTLKNSGMLAITSSFHADDPTVTSSAKAGDAVGNFTVTSTSNYSMLGINQANLKTFVDNQIKNQINTKQQAIQDDGLGQATFTVNSAGDNPKVSVQVSATIGPNISQETIKQQVVGMKKADVVDALDDYPSVKSVDVKFSPFWVNKVPKQTSKITIIYSKANGQ